MGTACADPTNSNLKSMSVTGRADRSGGILRQHDTLGVMRMQALFFAENAHLPH